MPSVALLVAEDEYLIAEDLREHLVEAGYEVLVASNGTEAADTLEGNYTRLRGLITDIRLGIGADGWTLAHRGRELIRQLAVVYITGDSAHEWAANGVPKSILIQKPFVTAQVTTAIANLLNEQTPI